MGFAENVMEKAYKDTNKRLKYFEQYKKEILAAYDINNEIRNKLMLVPKAYWDDFNKYLLNDPVFLKALNAANPQKEEKSKVTSKKKEIDDFDFDDDDEFNFDDGDDDEIEEINDNSKNINNILRMKQAIINEFINDEYLDSDEVEELIEYVADLLIDNNISKLQDFFEDLLIKSKADKTIESIQRILLLHQVFYIAANTCDNMAKVLNSKSINSFIDELHNYYYVRFQQKMKEASEVANKIKAKQNWKKVGKMLLTGFALPFIGYIKMGEALDSYNSRPEVQGKRRIESIRYYCKFCGNEFKTWGAASNIACPNRIRYDKAKANLEGRTPPTYHGHMKYEGSQKSEYECKNCGKKYKTIWEMVNDVCFVKARDNKDKYNRNNKPGLESDILTISRHEPAL